MTTQCSIPREETATAGSLDWTTGLQRCGYYYEGFTDNLQETLNKHSAATVTTYGICRSHTSNSSKVNKENRNPEVRIFKKGWLCQTVSFLTQ